MVKPVVSSMNAWSCTVISVFAMVILSILGSLFNRNHHSMMESGKDPEDGKAVAASIFIAVAVYAVFFVFCGLQALLHLRASRRGQISLN